MTQPSQSNTQYVRSYKARSVHGDLLMVFRRGEDADVAILIEDGLTSEPTEYVLSLEQAERLGLALIRESRS